MRDIRQTKEYANYLSKTGWVVERLDQTNYFIKKLPLIGSFIKIQRPEEMRTEVVNSLARKYRAFQIIVEPKNKRDQSLIVQSGFKKRGSPFLPSKTLRVDLTKSKEKLFTELKKDCRRAIKKNKKVSINRAFPLNKFRNVWRKTIGFDRYVPSLSQLMALKKSFGKSAAFFSLRDSGAVFLKTNQICYYWHAFTGDGGRKNKVQYKILWEGILWAKMGGAKVFDFEGIYDERFPNKSWLGFTHFKKSFGGSEYEYPGAFVKNLLPFSLWISKRK